MELAALNAREEDKRQIVVRGKKNKMNIYALDCIAMLEAKSTNERV